MKALIKCQISARSQKVGRSEFVVISRFCGYETILQKLTRLMEDELGELPTGEQPRDNSFDKTLDKSER